MNCKILNFFLAFLFFYSNALAQTDYNKRADFLKTNSVWILPDSCGLDFNKSPKEINSSYMNFQVRRNGSIWRLITECMTSVSHPVTGELLFYSNGSKCWAADGSLMPNGSDLLGDTVGTTVQGVLTVPVPGTDDQYYLFSLMYQGGIIKKKVLNDTIMGSLFYNVIDMKLNGGKGDIVQGKKNLVLDTVSLGEAMIAIPGDNCDVWLLVHHSEQPMYRAFRIDKDGVASNPTVSITNGSIIPDNTYMFSSMAVSPNRKLVAISSTWWLPGMGGLMLAKFDASTGKIFDEIQIGASVLPSLKISQGSCVAFSPDNTKIYCTDIYDFIQYDISKYDTNYINSSRFLLATTTQPVCKLRLYNDTLYGGLQRSKHLLTVSTPNFSGGLSDFKLAGIRTDIGDFQGLGLPSEVVSALIPPTVFSRIDTTVCANTTKTIDLRPRLQDPANQYIWSDASKNSSMMVKETGTYWVSYNDGCYTYVDTFSVSFETVDKPIISTNGFELSTSNGYSQYQWLLNENIIAGATNRSCQVKENGAYRVVVGGAFSCMDTSDVYTVSNYGETSMFEQYDMADVITIYPNPATHMLRVVAPISVEISISSMDGRVVLQASNVQSIDLNDLTPGCYLVKVFDSSGVLLKLDKLVKL